MAIYKVEAEGDVVYIDAESEDAAFAYLTQKIGDVPRSLCTLTVVDELPADEILL